MRDVFYQPAVPEVPKIERAKTPVKSTGIGGLGNAHRELSGSGVDSHTSTFASIAAKGMSLRFRLLRTLTDCMYLVRPKLASLSLRRNKGHHVSRSTSATPTTNEPPQMPFICATPVEPVPPPYTPFARLVPREPVVRRSLSLCDVKRGGKPPRPTHSKLDTLSNFPRPKTSGGPSKLDHAPSFRCISRSPLEKCSEDLGVQPRSRALPALPARTVNRHATVYAPAPSLPVSSSPSSTTPKHLVKPSLSLTLPNGESIVHEPLLLSPIPCIRSTTSPVTPPPPSRPPPRAHLPESPSDFNFGFDIKPESWDSSTFPPRPPSAAFSIASYYYGATETNVDYRDVITRCFELGDVGSVRSLEIRDNGEWETPGSRLKVPHASPDGPPKTPAQLLPLDRRSMLPTPEPFGNGKFPPLPPPPMHNKKLPPAPTAMGEVGEDADESTQVLRLRRSPSSRSHLTPSTPDTPPLLLTPKTHMVLPNLATEDIYCLPNQEVLVLAKQPPLRIRSKRSLRRPVTGT